MRECVGDIWDFKRYGWIVVPITWTPEASGRATMDTGTAAQACAHYPSIPYIAHALISEEYGTPRLVAIHKNGGGVILFPTKLHRRQKASLELIETGLRALVQLPITGNIYLPLLGCGYGLLREKRVLPLMQQHLDRDRFILVRRSEDVVSKYPTAFRTTRAKHNPGGAVDRSVWDAR